MSTHHTPTVLVTDGEQRAALAIVRSLGAAGARCIVASAVGNPLAGASRYAAREVRVSDSADRPDSFAAEVASLSHAEAVDLIIPVSEPSLFALLARREQLGAPVPFPDLEQVRAICDKERVLETARSIGIRVPRQIRLDRADGDRDIPFAPPFVLKPHRSVFTAADGSRGKTGVRWVHDASQIHRELAVIPAEAFPVLVQEAIEGPGLGVFTFVQDGELLAHFGHRRLREKPPSGGVSVVRESAPVPPDLLRLSLDLLSRFDWSGVAMVEYKLDERTQEPVLMEINGRFWGSLQLAIDAGVDFPRLLMASVLGNRSEPVADYRHVRSRWLWGDVDHLIAIARDPRVPGVDKARTLGAWLRAFGPDYRPEVLRWKDARPFWRESAAWVRHALGRP